MGAGSNYRERAMRARLHYSSQLAEEKFVEIAQKKNVHTGDDTNMIYSGIEPKKRYVWPDSCYWRITDLTVSTDNRGVGVLSNAAERQVSLATERSRPI